MPGKAGTELMELWFCAWLSPSPNSIIIVNFPVQLCEFPISPETFAFSQWRSISLWLCSKKELGETPWIPLAWNADKSDAFGTDSLSDSSPVRAITFGAGVALVLRWLRQHPSSFPSLLEIHPSVFTRCLCSSKFPLEASGVGGALPADVGRD